MKPQKKPIKRLPNPVPPAAPSRNQTPTPQPDAALEAARHIDRSFRTSLVQFTGPVDFPAFSRAFFDGLMHVAWSPGTQMKLASEQLSHLWDLSLCLMNLTENKTDRRFKDPTWDQWPFSLYRNIFIEREQHLESRFDDVSGISDHSRRLMTFITRQITAMMNPANSPVTNPKVIRTTIDERGRNLLRGLSNLVDNLEAHDGQISVRHSREEYHRIGETLGCTPGKVVFRNRLVEVLMFAPTTQHVAATPVLLVPAWINKFYVLDLRPQNSLAAWLRDQGMATFIVSWKNVDGSYRDMGIEDYMKEGVIAAIEAVKTVTGASDVHLAGYCMGAILAAITAAWLRGKEDTSIRTLSFFAAQLDFSDAGDLRSFIDESQISFLSDLMQDHGYLEKTNMSQTFSLLRARELYWKYVIDEFFIGKEPFNLDFLFWNDDGTRMPTKLHIDILRRLYLEDELTEGKFRFEEKSLDLRDIDMDLYSVGTVGDHIAPWKSVYRIPHFVSSPIKFILASSGHIAGVINPPEPQNGHYRTDGELGKGPDHWQATSRMHEGSWWPDWVDWMKKRSDGEGPAWKCPPKPEFDLGNAPGTYVHEK